MIELKLAFALAVYWTIALMPELVDGGNGVVFTASVVAALAVLWKVAVRLTKATRRWSRGIDHMLDLPGWQRDTDARLDRIEEKVAAAEPDVVVGHIVKQSKK